MPRQDVSVELYYDGAWHDLVVSGDVLADTPIVIMRGDGDESAALRPTLISLRLANGADLYRTSNPASPLYGKAGVNAPLRVGVAGVIRGIGEVYSWKCDQTRDFRAVPRRGRAWVDIEANGIFGRVNQWSEDVESTMVKGMKSFTNDLIGIWPLEDESTGTLLTQIVPGGFSGRFTGDVVLGDDERPAGSARSVKFTTAGDQISGTFIDSALSGWQVSFAMFLPTAPASGTYEEIFYCYDSLGRRWSWEVNDTSYAWTVLDTDGTTTLVSSSSPYGSTSTGPTQWVRFAMKVSVSGGTVTFARAWYAEGQASSVGVSGTFASTATGSLRTWAAEAHTHNVSANYTGVFGLDDPTAFLFNAGTIADFNGHVGETAGDRFDRVLDELGLPRASNGDNALSAAMGGQPAARLAELLREIRDTDDAVLFESRTALAAVLTMRNFRYNLTPVLTLNVDDADGSGLPNLPTEVSDDLPIHNIVTASQRDGGQYTVEDSTTAMGSAPPPIGRGEYRQTVDVNVADEAADLPQQANWWLRRGTVDLPRFPQVVVNLAALDPVRIVEVESVTIGSVIEIVNYRENTIRLHVIGYREVIGTHSRIITYTCAPDQQFDVGTYDDGVKRYDLATASVSAAVAASVSTITIAITADEQWSEVSAYDLMISGERVGVPAGAMGARTGSAGAYQQILTGAVRGKNGINKLLPAGSSVRIATPGRWAL